MKKYVYSGRCRLCDCGREAGFDSHGKLLYTGDIVVILTRDENGILEQASDGLTVVVARQYTSYSDGSVKETDPEATSFIMGIASVEHVKIDEENKKGWHVIKVKDYRDAVDGEHWKDFGFSYRDAKND